MRHQYRFKRGDRVRTTSGKHVGATGAVDSKVFQYSVYYLEECTPGYHVVRNVHVGSILRLGDLDAQTLLHLSPEPNTSFHLIIVTRGNNIG